MEKIKSLLSVIMFGIIFLGTEIVAYSISLLYESNNDIEYARKLAYCVRYANEGDVEAFKMYMGLCYEVVPMTLFLTCLFLLIPVFIYTKKKKIVLFKKLPMIDYVQLYSIAVIINIVVSGVVEMLPKAWVTNYDNSIGYIENLSFFPLLLSTGICAPLIEEIFFRYLMVNKLKSKPIIAIIFPALLFGIAHGDIIQGSYAFILGMMLSYLYIKTDNLLVPLILHIGINTSSIIISAIPYSLSISLVILCLLLSIFLCIKNKDFLNGIFYRKITPLERKS